MTQKHSNTQNSPNVNNTRQVVQRTTTGTHPYNHHVITKPLPPTRSIHRSIDGQHSWSTHRLSVPPEPVTSQWSTGILRGPEGAGNSHNGPAFCRKTQTIPLHVSSQSQTITPPQYSQRRLRLALLAVLPPNLATLAATRWGGVGEGHYS